MTFIEINKEISYELLPGTPKVLERTYRHKKDREMSCAGCGIKKMSICKT